MAPNLIEDITLILMSLFWSPRISLWSHIIACWPFDPSSLTQSWNAFNVAAIYKSAPLPNTYLKIWLPSGWWSSHICSAHAAEQGRTTTDRGVLTPAAGETRARKIPGLDWLRIERTVKISWYKDATQWTSKNENGNLQSSCCCK